MLKRHEIKKNNKHFTFIIVADIIGNGEKRHAFKLSIRNVAKAK